MGGNGSSARRLDRITTGISSLDQVLDGGIPKGSVVFVAGLPGAGKSIFCEQLIWANASEWEKVLYLTTLAEPMMKTLRFAGTFDFFEPNLVGKAAIYADVGSTLTSRGPEAVVEEIERLIHEHRPAVLVLDSFKVFGQWFQSKQGYRAFIFELMTRLAVWEVTAILVGEYGESDLREEPEFAVADGIIYLYGTEEPTRQRRLMRVVKMRGTQMFGGDHVFEINGSGIEVYPRMSPVVSGEYAVPSGRLPSTIEGLDEILEGGPFKSTVTLIAGPSGSGKTLMALGFALGSARSGEPVLYISLEESPAQLMRNCADFGWDLQSLIDEKTLDMVHISPSELDLDRHATAIRERAVAGKAKCVVIDSISSFQASVESAAKYRSYVWALTDYFKRSGVTTVLTLEQPGEDSDPHISLFTDTIILLSQAPAQAGPQINVAKLRGSSFDRSTHKLRIEPPTISVNGPAGRAPTGK